MTTVFNGLEIESLTRGDGIDHRVSVRLASTSNIASLSTADPSATTIDGGTLAVGDRVLLKNQSTASENGIYEVTALAANGWKRAEDLVTGDDASFIHAFVQEGSAQNQTGWVCTSVRPTAVVDTHDLTWVQFDVLKTLSPVRGGTGINSYTTGDILYADATDSLSVLPKSGTDGFFLTSTASGPSWSKSLPDDTRINGPFVDGTDVVNKDYVDAVAQGLDVKESVRVGTTGTLVGESSISTVSYSNTGGTSGRGEITGTLAVSETMTVDGVSLVDGDRILIKNEQDGGGEGGDANGIYTVDISGTSYTLTRATDFDEDTEVTAAVFTFIEEGTVNADNGWVLTTDNPITIGGASGTSLAWAQFSGAGQINAGLGLIKTGNKIDVDPSGVMGFTGTDDSDTLIVESSATTGQVLLSAGSANTSATWGAVDLDNTDSHTGTLGVANGGTNLSSYATGDILYATGTTTLAGLTKGANNTVLTVNSSGNLEWTDDVPIDTVIDVTNSTTAAQFTAPASAVNYITISGATTGNDPTLTATGTDTNIDFTLVSKGTGDINLDAGTTGVINIGSGSSTAEAEVRWYDADESHYLAFKSPADLTANVTYTWPINPQSGYILETDASGNLTWVDPNADKSYSFMIMPMQVKASSVNYKTVAYFSWNDAEYGGTSTRTVLYEVTAVGSGGSNRALDIAVYNATTDPTFAGAGLGSDTGVTTSGFRTFTFSDPGANARLAVVVRKDSVSGSNPEIYGIQFDFDK